MAISQSITGAGTGLMLGGLAIAVTSTLVAFITFPWKRVVRRYNRAQAETQLTDEEVCETFPGRVGDGSIPVMHDETNVADTRNVALWNATYGPHGYLNPNNLK